jgi:hypothetical protein
VLQVATYRALALRNTDVGPRRLGAVEGTDVVRGMLDDQLPAFFAALLPRSLSQVSECVGA